MYKRISSAKYDRYYSISSYKYNTEKYKISSNKVEQVFSMIRSEYRYWNYIDNSLKDNVNDWVYGIKMQEKIKGITNLVHIKDYNKKEEQ